MVTINFIVHNSKEVHCTQHLLTHINGYETPLLYRYILATCNYYVINSVALRGLVQSPCGKIDVIMTLTFYPPPPSLNEHFSIDSVY